jgi:exodeoxyribonuclease VII small subunit
MKTFEERLSRLEELSEKIRDADLPLEEAVDLFEEGMKLSRSLEKELGRIERKVEILINNPAETGQEPALELFPELSEDETSDEQ